MADKKISDGTARTLAATDVFETENPGEAVQYKVTLAAIQAALQAGGIVPVAQITVTQASHGFSAGDAIGHNGSAYAKADASSGGDDAIGVVLSVSGNDFVLALPGYHKLTSHGFTAGWNYLSETAGALTTTPPGPGARIQAVAFVVDADYFILMPMPGIE